jgi:voltage-gated potassium channel
MEAVPTPGPRRGEPRSESDAAFVQRFDRLMRWPLIVAAVLPLIVVPESGGWFADLVGVLTWIVFLVDYVVHARRLNHYGRTRIGRFDLVIVVVTAPWFLLPGAQAGRFVVLLRLARLGRIVFASRGARRLLQRLGRVAAVALGVTLVSSLVAYHAEHPVNSEFKTFGDALWWGIVTLTTVGYGDIVPQTPTGRWAAVAIMLTGIAVLGVLAGSLASFFRLDSGGATSNGDTTSDADGAVQGQVAVPAEEPESFEHVMATMADEVASLRRQIEVLTERIGVGDGDQPP